MAADHLVRLEPEHFALGCVHASDHAFVVDLMAGYGRVLKQVLKPVFDFSQAVFEILFRP
jgi:hypothetical protein